MEAAGAAIPIVRLARCCMGVLVRILITMTWTMKIVLRLRQTPSPLQVAMETGQ